MEETAQLDGMIDWIFRYEHRGLDFGHHEGFISQGAVLRSYP